MPCSAGKALAGRVTLTVSVGPEALLWALEWLRWSSAVCVSHQLRLGARLASPVLTGVGSQCAPTRSVLPAGASAAASRPSGRLRLCRHHCTCAALRDREGRESTAPHPGWAQETELGGRRRSTARQTGACTQVSLPHEPCLPLGPLFLVPAVALSAVPSVRVGMPHEQGGIPGSPLSLVTGVCHPWSCLVSAYLPSAESEGLFSFLKYLCICWKGR